MLISLLFSNPLAFFIIAFGIILSLTIHEYAHARAADTLGDPTPRSQGRLNLDPRSHLDPLGTLALLFLGFGWGKPVMFDPYNLRDPRRDSALIALAGPTSNILFAIALSLLIRFVPSLDIASTIFVILLKMNVTLAIFNLVPIFPLDGEKILGGILSPNLYREFSAIMSQYGTIILVLMLLPIASGTSPISALISPIVSFVTGLLL